MSKVQINTIEWASDICGMFINELEMLTGKTYTTFSKDDQMLLYTEEGQEIFNVMYDSVIDYIETGLQTTHEKHEVELIKEEQ